MEPIQRQAMQRQGRTIRHILLQPRIRHWTLWGAIALISSGIGSEVGGRMGNNTNPHIAAASQPSPPIRRAMVDLAMADTAFVGSDRPLIQFGDEGPKVQAIQALLQVMGYYSGPINGRYQEGTVLAVIAFQQSAGLNGDGIIGPTTWAKLLPLPQQIAATNVLEPPPVSDPSTERSPSATLTPISAPATPNSSGEGTSASNGSSNSSDTTASSPPPATDDVTLPTLRLGMRGSAVTSLQERLRRLGFLQGAVDGVFGSQTEAAVKAAQRSFSLNPDGIVGPATWTALLQ
ncbi:MAG: peptidoglycan-binding protein [Leptolyngbyaceae cyanobacterium]